MMLDRFELYRKVLLSRLLEEEIARLWHQGRVSGEMHLGIGEEGVVAGVLDHLSAGDALACDHRPTPPMVMWGVDPTAIVAECLGSTAGLGAGLGGHMHLMSKTHLAASSGIVGSSGPIACGFALAHQHLRPDRVAVAFFGEGAMNQGMLMESLNLAGCWKLPVIFVCKDNQMAITTASSKVTAGKLPDRVRSFGLPAAQVDGSDVEAVWNAAEKAVARARRKKGPSYIHATCVRPEGHLLGDPLQRIVRHPVDELKEKVGPLTKAVISGEGPGVIERAGSLAGITGMVTRAAGMRGKDPVARLRSKVKKDAARLAAIEQEVESLVTAAVDKALRSLEEATA